MRKRDCGDGKSWVGKCQSKFKIYIAYTKAVFLSLRVRFQLCEVQNIYRLGGLNTESGGSQ